MLIDVTQPVILADAENNPVQRFDALPDTYRGTVHYRNAGEGRWRADGFRPIIPFSVPDGHVVIEGTRGHVWDGAEGAFREVYETQPVEQAQAAELQAVVDAAGDEIRELEAIVDRLGLTRPVTVESARAEARANIEAMDAEAKDQALADLIDLIALFNGLRDAGLKEATINAVWNYMVATGQA